MLTTDRHSNKLTIAQELKIPVNVIREQASFTEKLESGHLISNVSLSKQFALRMNIVRFLAICSIVWGHSLYQFEHTVFHTFTDQAIQSVLLQIGRIGTVMFFIITGYFLSDKITGFSVLSYLRYRLRSLIIPWAIFLSLYILIQVFHTVSLKQLVEGNLSGALQLVSGLFKAFVFHSAYWFVPVSVAATLILIAFKNHVNKKGFGLLLAVISVFYSINLYHGWISVNHTKAIAGYVFYIWLGVQIKNNIHTLHAVLAKISWPALICLASVTFVIACMEGMKLTAIGSQDPYASIRWSNAVLSILLLLSCLKSGKMGGINNLNPQSNVYGVYLAHSIIISELLPASNTFISSHNLYVHMPQLIIAQLIFFAFTFTATYLLVMGLKRTPLYFMVGRK